MSKPERDAMHQYSGQEAGRVRDLYRREVGKRGRSGRGAAARRAAIVGAAITLLAEADAPPSLICLFSEMLGGVAQPMPRRWLREVVEYEARIEGRAVPTWEIVDDGILPKHGVDRDHVMKRVRAIRRHKWYPKVLEAQRYYLIDNP